jgi:hypothetical protein
MGNLTHRNTVATGWRRTSVPSCWPKGWRALLHLRWSFSNRSYDTLQWLQCYHDTSRPLAWLFILSGETLTRCPREEPPWNRRFPLAGCNFLFQSVPMYDHLNCVMVIQDAVGIIWPSGYGYHSCFLLLIQDSFFQILKLISYSNIPKNYQYYGHNSI